MSNKKSTQNSAPSEELVRQLLAGVDKHDLKLKQLGILQASQNVRAIKRLHTWYPGQRAEFDFTKYGVFLFPNKNWSTPVLYHSGMGVDHASGAVGSFVTTGSPSARDVVRLYRRYVMPKGTWLPPSARLIAQKWDMFGVPLLVTMDNGPDFVSQAATLMFLLTGTIVLRVPPRRGDLKGTVERTQGTFETRFISHMPGYVPRKAAGLNNRHTKYRQRAMAAANMTVAEFEEKFLGHILEFNDELHPRLQKQRIGVYRTGLELAPPLLLTGRLQQRATFALTYEVELTREGVEVENMHFNSTALHEVYRTYSGKVIVKLDPDDVRSVLVFVPKQAQSEPIEAVLTTFSFADAPVSLELYQLTRQTHAVDAKKAMANAAQSVPYVFEQELGTIQTFTGPSVPSTTLSREMQVAVQAAALPQVRDLKANRVDGQSLSDLLGSSRLTDD